MSIADRIQNLRKVKGISQEELANRVGVSRQAVSKWESEQSVPEIDKIIIMSDYFEVTTDYILKGIENDNLKNERTVDANIFVIVSTVLNFIGLIVASAVWYEKQTSMAVVSGLVFMAVGCMVFGIGLTYSTMYKANAKRLFWTINIWLLVFIPLSFLYNVLFSRFGAPYPLFYGTHLNLIVFPAFWLVYIIICLSVVVVQVRRGRR